MGIQQLPKIKWTDLDKEEAENESELEIFVHKIITKTYRNM